MIRTGSVVRWHSNEYIKYYYIQIVRILDMHRHIDTLTIDIRVLGGSWEIYINSIFFFLRKEGADMTHTTTATYVENTKTHPRHEKGT